MQNMLERSITGIVFVAVIIGSILWRGSETVTYSYPFQIVMFCFAALSLFEFANMLKVAKYASIKKEVFITVGLILFAILLPAPLDWGKKTPIVTVLILIPMIYELFRNTQTPIQNITGHAFGLVYIVLPLYCACEVVHRDYQKGILMFALIWSNDTFAYVGGRLFGKTKLFERVSPNKTWEGAFTGILVTIVIGLLITWCLEIKISLIFTLFLAIGTSVCSIFGDLFESQFKRALDIKDSGNILPGHGGMLDRLDAMLFAVPFFLVAIQIYDYLLKLTT